MAAVISTEEAAHRNSTPSMIISRRRRARSRSAVIREAIINSTGREERRPLPSYNARRRRSGLGLAADHLVDRDADLGHAPEDRARPALAEALHCALIGPVRQRQ